MQPELYGRRVERRHVQYILYEDCKKSERLNAEGDKVTKKKQDDTGCNRETSIVPNSHRSRSVGCD